MTRPEKVAQAQVLRATGLTLQQIADKMGIRSRKTVHDWLADPDRSRALARRQRYAGTCSECGKPTDGSNGPGKAPAVCLNCLSAASHEQAVERHVEAIRRFHARYGRPPNATDFNPAHARHLGHRWRAERFYDDGDYPSTNSVVSAFGSWSTALRVAGFEPFNAGEYKRVKGTHLGEHLQGERDAA